MANWTDIPDARLEPGAPARSVDAIALRDNVIAQTEGAVGAPKTQTEAIQNQSITVEKMAVYSGSPDKLIWRNFLKSVDTTTTQDNAFEFFFPQAGVYKFVFFIDSTGDKRTILNLDGADVYSQDDLSGGLTREVTITANQGSHAIFKIASLTATQTALIRDMRVYHEKVVPINGV